MKKSFTGKVLSLVLLAACAVGIGNAASLTNSDVVVNNDDIIQTKKVLKVDDSESESVNITDEDSDISISITGSTITSLSHSYKIYVNSETNAYMLGYYGTGDEYFPLTFNYDVEDADGNVEHRITALEKQSIITTYDFAGEVLGASTFTTYADLPLTDDFTVLEDTITITNIFGVYSDSSLGYNKYYPDFTKSYYSIPTISYTRVYTMNDYFSTYFISKTSFNNYTSLNVNVHNQALESYKELYSSFDDYEDDIADGSCYLNLQLAALVDTAINVTFKDGTTQLFDISTDESIYLTEDDNTVRFLIEDLDAEEVESFYITNLNYRMKLTKIDEDGVESDVSRSTKNVRFTMVNFTSDEEVSTLNVTAMLWIAFFSILVVVGASDTLLYFYRKDKYKNDEFRRVNDKNFLKNSMIFWAGIEITILDILIISTRAWGFNNSISIYNPLDVYIIWFTLIVLFFIGFLVVFFKNVINSRKERLKVERLGLNDADEDDGTN
jgi:hypothetical protein